LIDHFKAVYYPSGDDSAVVDAFLHNHENYVTSNGKTLMLINFVQRSQLN